MSVDSNLYQHPLDREALKTLKSIPGFTQVLKVFMEKWNEKIFRIQNLSTNIRVSERQLKKYHDMLPPICAKLGIDVPELYVELDVRPNAYTYGDTKPFIVMTSGLLEQMPEELIPTVLAHECGHIACHHTLYHTMGRLIINGAFSFFDMKLLTLPIRNAFYYWMRCSEFSADRAAILYDGNADHIVEMCLRFAGLTKNIEADFDLDEFLNQAADYKDFTSDSILNKGMELYMFSTNSHPLNVIRAQEGLRWSKQDEFAEILADEAYTQKRLEEEGVKKISMPYSSSHYTGKNYNVICNELKNLGFKSIKTHPTTDHGLTSKVGDVQAIKIGNSVKFDEYQKFFDDETVFIIYYQNENSTPVRQLGSDQIVMPNSSGYYSGKDYRDVINELKQLGFINIDLQKNIIVKNTIFNKENNVYEISINGRRKFDKNDYFNKEDAIIIVYNEILK